MLRNRKLNTRKLNQKEKALKLSMPPAAPAEMTFSDVLENEYKCLESACAHADECRLSWERIPMHLSSASCRLPYRKKPCEIKPQVHIPQLKLFLSELKFLMEFAGFDRQMNVIYIGAANGKHIVYLANLFPKLSFYLFGLTPDANEFNHVDNIITFSDSFKHFSTDQAAIFSRGSLFKMQLLIISNIRSGGSPRYGYDFDSCCAKDMEDQLTWVRLIQPDAALLKFHLSCKPGKTIWLAPCSEKHILFAPFSSKSGTELQLVTIDPWKMREYDNTMIEEQMYYFNNFTRVCQYGLSIPGFSENPLKDKLHMDDCWDCCAMREICMEFLSKKYNQECCGPTLEVHEVISAAVYHSTILPTEMSNIVSAYSSCIGENELYEFIGAVIRHCGTNISRNMEKSPHGILAHGEQWITHMRKFQNFHITVKSGKQRYSSQVIEEIYKLYASSGDRTPAIGIYPTTL